VTSRDDRLELRPARALLGWMTPRRAVLAQAGQQEEHDAAPEYEERARQKRLVAAVRRPAFGTQDVVAGLPRSLQWHASTLGKTRRGVERLAAGWQPALVDLRRVCAMVPLAFTDVDLPDIGADDLAGLAAVTLPPEERRVEAEYDGEIRAWVVREDGAGVRVLGQFRGEGEPGVVLGLVVAHSPSFVEVARVGDRFVLVRGYEPAISLLARGIHAVPALVHGHRTARQLPFGRSTLRRSVVLGRRPPLLPDFLDDDVSAEVFMPPLKRLLMVRALEIAHYHIDA
jgi:hypothetical protein